MSKLESFADYPPRSLATTEAALLTIWPALELFHDDLVLIGGLAVHHLTRPGGWRGAVTMDVDFGIALAAGGEGMTSIQSCLFEAGFREGEARRLQRELGGFRLYVDFVTEDPPKLSGGRAVDDIRASLAPGINRALACRRFKTISGLDAHGQPRTCTVAIADIGPLLVLKLNAFGGPAGRRAGKDAYDLLLAVTAYAEGPQAAIDAFRAEAITDNSGYAHAVAALRRDFAHADADGPRLAAAFHTGDAATQRRLREELATVAKFLLGE